VGVDARTLTEEELQLLDALSSRIGSGGHPMDPVIGHHAQTDTGGGQGERRVSADLPQPVHQARGKRVRV